MEVGSAMACQAAGGAGETRNEQQLAQQRQLQAKKGLGCLREDRKWNKKRGEIVVVWRLVGGKKRLGGQD